MTLKDQFSALVFTIRNGSADPLHIIVNGRVSRALEIRITLKDLKGHKPINLRVWFDTGNGEYRPGKHGLVFTADLLPDVMPALAALKGGAA